MAWGAIFEEMSRCKESYSFCKICMSIFPGTSSPNELAPMRPLAAFSNRELEGRSPSQMQGVLGGRSPPRMPYVYKTSKITGHHDGWFFNIFMFKGPQNGLFPAHEFEKSYATFQAAQLKTNKKYIGSPPDLFFSLVESVESV